MPYATWKQSVRAKSKVRSVSPSQMSSRFVYQESLTEDIDRSIIFAPALRLLYFHILYFRMVNRGVYGKTSLLSNNVDQTLPGVVGIQSLLTVKKHSLATLPHPFWGLLLVVSGAEKIVNEIVACVHWWRKYGDMAVWRADGLYKKQYGTVITTSTTYVSIVWPGFMVSSSASTTRNEVAVTISLWSSRMASTKR